VFPFPVHHPVSVLGGSDTDAMDTHSSATETSGTVTASSEQGSYLGWKAADDATGSSNRWLAAGGSGVPQTWQYQFTTDQLSGGYSIEASGVSGWETYMPNTWKFQGSHNGSDWDDLDSRSGETSWGQSEKREYTFTNSTYYEYYRFNITALDGAAYAQVGEFEILI